MRLGGALGGVELTPEHYTFKSLISAFRVDDAVAQAQDAFIKFQEYECGNIGEDDVFVTYGDYGMAILFSIDGFLPSKTQKLLSFKTLNLTNEIIDKKMTIETFFIYPPKRGRKKDASQFIMLSAVGKKIKSGLSNNAAYESVAKDLGKKKVTVRRAWEKYQFKKKNKGGN